MSVVIDALRLGVVEALRADPVIAGSVSGRVFDSRIEAYSETEPTPCISVFTEEDEGEGWSENNGGPPFRTIVDLILEIYVAYKARAEGQDDEEGAEFLVYPETSKETEALLGVLRHRCEHVIAVGDSPWSRRLRQLVIRRVTETASKRFKSDDVLVRSAIRVVTMKVEIKEIEDEDPRVPPTGPFHALPDPLRSLCEAMPPGSGRDTCLLMQKALLPGIEPVVYLERTDMTIRPGPTGEGSDPADGAQYGATALTPQPDE